MDITYIGHSCFKLKGKEAVVITDPFDRQLVGFSMPDVSADIVTISHHHLDHDAVKLIKGTTRREKPYVIDSAGEYEINNVGVFGWGSFHDDQKGASRGKNVIYSIIIDGVRLVHLGDIGHSLSDDMVEGLGTVDVLLVPVGGTYTIDYKEAGTIIEQLSPSIVIPMHYYTNDYPKNLDKLHDLTPFLKAMGITDLKPVDKLKVTPENLPEEQTIIIMERG